MISNNTKFSIIYCYISSFYSFFSELLVLLFLLSLLLLYCLHFLLYFENKEIFWFCVWIQICRTFLNLIYYSFVGFCALVLSLVLNEFKQIRINIYCMICLDLLNAWGKGQTQSPSVTFFLLFLLSDNVSWWSEIYFYFSYLLKI